MDHLPVCQHCHTASWTGSDPDPECPWCGKPKGKSQLEAAAIKIIQGWEKADAEGGQYAQQDQDIQAYYDHMIGWIVTILSDHLPAKETTGARRNRTA